jgi:hypothetical protein
MTALISKFGKTVFLAAGFVAVVGISEARAQALNPFGNPFAALVVPTKTTRVEIGGVSAVTDGDTNQGDLTENDFAIRINRKVGKTAAISASVWANPREDDDSATFQVGAAGAISQRSSVWVNFGGSATSEHVPNSQYDFGGSYALDQQLIFTGAASIRNYQGGPSVRLLAPSVVWLVNQKVWLVATAINSSVSRLAPGVTAGSNLALFNVIFNPNPALSLNVGGGYGETDFLAAVAPTQTFSDNNAAANFDAQLTWRFNAVRGLSVYYWLDNGGRTNKTNTFQASLFFEF